MIDPLFAEPTYGGRKSQDIADEMDDVVRWVVVAAATTSRTSGVVLIRDIRERDVVLVRHAVMIVSKRLHCSLASIARVLKRDHTSVRYATEEAKINAKWLASRQPHIDAIEAYLKTNFVSRRQIIDMGMRLREATGEAVPRERVAPFPPGVDKMIMAGVPTPTIIKAYSHTGWIVP